MMGRAPRARLLIFAHLIFCLLVSLASSSAVAGSLAELRPPSAIPEATPGKPCPVPPLPPSAQQEGEGWSLHAGIAWRNFDMDGVRYYVEYQVLKRIAGGLLLRPFPSLYMIDLNRNGIFDVPGEAWIDIRGDGRCADLIPVPAPREPEPDINPKRPA